MEKKQSVETSQFLILYEEFKNTHRKSKTAFTRTRKLYFPLLIVLRLKKSLKSLQLILNEFTLAFDDFNTVSNSAFTQARAN